MALHCECSTVPLLVSPLISRTSSVLVPVDRHLDLTVPCSISPLRTSFALNHLTSPRFASLPSVARAKSKSSPLHASSSHLTSLSSAYRGPRTNHSLKFTQIRALPRKERLDRMSREGKDRVRDRRSRSRSREMGGCERDNSNRECQRWTGRWTRARASERASAKRSYSTGRDMTPRD